MSTFRSSPLAVPCPACGAVIRTTMGKAMDDATVVCPRGHSVRLVDKNDGIRRVDHSLTDFKRSVERLNRQLRRRR